MPIVAPLDDINVNFHNFLNSILILLRANAGENWHKIMAACAKQKSLDYENPGSIGGLI